MTMQKKLFPYMLLAPYLVFFVLFLAYPILRGSYMSFFEWGIRGPKEFVGFGNYIDLFNNHMFWQAFRNTIFYTLLFVPSVVIIPLLLAVLLKNPMPGINLFRSIFFLPIVINVSISAIAIDWIMNPQIGVLNRLLEMVGIAKQTWLVQPGWAMIVVVMVSIWGRTGFNMIIYLAGLDNIPAELYEAADVDGSTPWQNLRYITIPLLKPVTLLVTVLSLIGGLQVFGEVYMLTSGGPFGSTRVLSYMLYTEGFTYFNFGVAAAIAVVMTVLIAILSAIQFRFFRTA